jgi:hypothetical protein
VVIDAAAVRDRDFPRKAPVRKESLEVESGNVLVVVSDSGPGLSPANLARFHGFLYGQGQWLGHRVVDLPLDRRSAWWSAMGNAERTLGCCLLHDAAARGKIDREAGAI